MREKYNVTHKRFLYQISMRYNLAILLLASIMFSCSDERNPWETPDSKSESEEVFVDENPTVIKYNYDSIIFQKFEYIGSWDSKATDSFYIFTKNSIEIIKPYLMDSSIRKYSCCPEHISGTMTIFSDGKAFRTYSVAADGGVVAEEIDTLCAILVPYNYQSRIKIPKGEWNLIISDVKRTKIKFDNN